MFVCMYGVCVVPMGDVCVPIRYLFLSQLFYVSKIFSNPPLRKKKNEK